MMVLATIPIALWLAALLAMPHKPLPGNEVEELVYSRLLGRHQRVALLALVVTLGAFIAGVALLPPRAQPTTEAATMQQVCAVASVYPQTCYTQKSDGIWLVETRQPNDLWYTVATMSRPPSPAELATGYHG